MIAADEPPQVPASDLLDWKPPFRLRLHSWSARNWLWLLPVGLLILPAAVDAGIWWAGLSGYALALWALAAMPAPARKYLADSVRPVLGPLLTFMLVNAAFDGLTSGL